MTESDRVAAPPRADGGSQAATASAPPPAWMPRSIDAVQGDAPAARRHGIIIRMG